MSYTLLAFLTRKPGTTPTAFKSHYENHHIPLLKDILGPDRFPTVHKRYYIPRVEEPIPDTTATDPHPPREGVILPSTVAGEFSWDCCAEVVFRDEAHYKAFHEALAAQGGRLRADEERFLDPGRMRVVHVGKGVEVSSFDG
ncbi:EthD domain-containing protein [Aspergillus minisclerotigenes]|uniref:EthD domain-containing protein n=1 Tax=Aspergillus minisclerotigenes TaxID=656917 RepID=A0A5N6IV34_9EURO|nr:EthD domain-containing protein [Aspergillus minisclerotigenes]